jgi:hypothetical protein
MTEAKELVELLRHGGLRCRTGALLLPKSQLGQESTIASRLGVQYIDFVPFLLKTLSVEATYVDITAVKLLNWLDDISATASERDCVLVANFDVPFSKIAHEDRSLFWKRFLIDFPHKKRGVIVSLPGVNSHSALLPEADTRCEWLAAKRLITQADGERTQA